MGAAATSGTSSSSGASSSTSSSSSSAGSAGITTNDFLTLLVTEIKNQDPTQQTNPMQYITQLVGVNSLEQLIQINQNLTPPTGTTSGTTTGTTTGSTTATGAIAHAPMSAAGKSLPLATTTASPVSAFLPMGSQGQIPAASSHAVAQALSKSVPLASQASPTQLPPSHIAMQPEELRAIQMSIPGAALGGLSMPGANVPTPASGASGGSLP